MSDPNKDENVKPDSSTRESVKIDQQEQLFMGFVSLIAGMTMQQLGKVVNPLTGKVERNLDVAKAWIETLKMIRAKTSGNLNKDEQSFLDTTIANLQMNYVDEVQKGPEKAEKEQEAPPQEKAERQPEPKGQEAASRDKSETHPDEKGEKKD